MPKPVAATDALSLRSLLAAAARAARGKRSRASVARYLVELEPRLIDLERRLLAGTWVPQRPVMLRVHDPKPRTISVQPFEDRVVHQALAAVLGPRLERTLIRDTYACRVGAGTHAALRRARAWARTYRYWVRLDVVRYFPSVDHAVLRELLAPETPEPWLWRLCDLILERGECERERAYFPGDDLFTPHTRDVGLPLGNLTSQLWANAYLSPVDHFVKDRLGHRAYLRYMDDMLLLGDDRGVLADASAAVVAACADRRLRIHPHDIQPTSGGVGIVGYRVLPDQVRVRRTSVARAERRLQALYGDVRAGRTSPLAAWESVRATFAHWDHADAWRLKGRLLRELDILDTPAAEWQRS
ncbi:MAG: RNA-directed DNA polymerase [Sandaracinaceae bacterium]|nr:RNA-directed DNA polymerase [Sandaracinaceae bacterium]